MPIERFTPSYPFTDDKLAQLRRIVPEAFEDGRLNFETLREVLEPNLDPEGTVADDGDRFGLIWPGKKEARRLAAIPSKGTLAPVYGQGLNPDGTPDDDGHNVSRNVFIEGENLEVLKIMQKAYAGRVKMIYIDPPYNTGNDFVYDDNFTEPLEHYLRRTGQIDDEGQKLTTNTKTDGRFHSKWLSMMYPRLRLARNLLREDGVIFVSIDDNEVHNLRQLMNEVFGEENFVTEIIWQKRTSPDSRTVIGSAHDYILLYSRDGNTESSLNKLPLSESRQDDYKNLDDDYRGPWASVDISAQAGHATKDQFYTIIGPTGIQHTPSSGRCWGMAERTYRSLEADNRIWFGKTGENKPRLKRFLSEADGMSTWSWWPNDEVGHNQEATKELKEIFGEAGIFDSPKPTRLLRRILHLATNALSNDIVLDFFAGSGSTADAVMQLNSDDNGNRRYVTVQIPEVVNTKNSISRKKFNHISNISRSRIEIVSKRLGSSFRSYCFAKKQLTRSESFSLQDQSNAAEISYNHQSLLWEVALQEGFPLDSRLEAYTVDGLAVTRVTSDFHDFALHCCFAEDIAPASAPKLDLGDNDVFICFDDALDDQTKLRLSDRGMLKTI